MLARKSLRYYQTALINLAVQKAKDDPDSIRFDPQGHALVEIENTRALEWMETNRRFQPDEIDELLAAYHINPRGTTFCNIDVRGDDELEKAFKRWLVPQNSKDPNTQRLEDISDALIASKEANSIINLQEEMEMHMRLKAQGLIKALHALGIKEDLWIKIQQEAAKNINAAVKTVYQNALLENENNGTLDFVKLNKALDRSRKYLSQNTCSNALMNACAENIPSFLNHFERIKNNITKEDYESLTAVHSDQLRTDVRKDGSGEIAGTVCWIGKTNNTAHSKRLNTPTEEDTQAFRPILRDTFERNVHNINEYVINGNETEIDITVEARVPSIAVIKNTHTADSILDVKEKLTADHKRMMDMLGAQYNEPLIYNLLTSLPFPLTDDANLQVPSAECILKGAHAFNHEQLNSGKPFWFVQNIPVNQHGKSLSYESDKVTVESTLMAEIAMLSTFATNYPNHPQIQSAYHDIINNCYVRYINNLNKEEFFNDSSHGREAIRLLTEFKNNV
ncbi:MAG: hypothetical protein JO149_06790, partial [Gammaproteobacteria bacterium]|nr:hypothetical protein [Gammaproteobacteria bacterium]